MKRFALSLCTHKTTANSIATSHFVMIVKHDSKDAAIGYGYEHLKQVKPNLDGWQSYDVDCIEITEEWFVQ